jgi:hypothetical protein
VVCSNGVLTACTLLQLRPGATIFRCLHVVDSNTGHNPASQWNGLGSILFVPYLQSSQLTDGFILFRTHLVRRTLLDARRRSAMSHQSAAITLSFRHRHVSFQPSMYRRTMVDIRRGICHGIFSGNWDRRTICVEADPGSRPRSRSFMQARD